MLINYPQVAAIQGGVVVSCQAGPDSPLNAPHIIAALARSCELGGAVGFRVDRPENIAAVRAVSNRPIIGINKIHEPGYEVFITPNFASARAVVEAGADIVAIDATERQRPGSESVSEIIQRIHTDLRVPVMADIGSAQEGLRAAEFGADIVATTLAGSNPYGTSESGPAIHIVRDLVKKVQVPIIVEGQIWTVEDIRACFESGAFAVVIGSAITVPQFITHRFVNAVADLRSGVS